MKKIALAASAMLLAATQSFAATSTMAPPASVEELKADRVKSLAKRDPRVTDLMPKVEARLAKMRAADPQSPLLARMQRAVDQIAMTSSSVAEQRARGDVDLLEAIARDQAPPTAAELAPLQERYKKIAEQFDDMALNKDLDRAFHVHDKFIRYTSLGLWDAKRIGEELERLETLISNAQDIPYGRSELVNGFKNRRLGAVAKLVYVGTNPHEELYLTNDRRSVGLVEEATGGSIAMETGDFVIQAPDGKLIDVSEANHPGAGVPFSPPVSLWMKSRVLEGKVPALTLKLVDESTKAEYKKLGAGDVSYNTVKDVLDGKLDDYLRRNLTTLGAAKTATLVGFMSNIDRDTAANAFGADGATPFYFVLDPKLKALAGDKLAEELKKRQDKGGFSGPKALVPELSNQYGDASIPDGPERVRDAIKKVSKMVAENAGESTAFYTSVGNLHGSKNAAKFGDYGAGNQTWNKLEYYWPGEGVVDWLGVTAIGSDPGTDPKGANMMEALEPVMAEVRSSTWQSTPIMLRGLAPHVERAPLAEAEWITTVFQKIIPATYPNISIAFLNIPDNLTLWSREGASAFRTNVSSNKQYKFPLRFKMLKQASSEQTAGQ